jgi:hypothetical protein
MVERLKVVDMSLDSWLMAPYASAALERASREPVLLLAGRFPRAKEKTARHLHVLRVTVRRGVAFACEGELRWS